VSHVLHSWIHTGINAYVEYTFVPCRGAAGASTGVLSTSPPYASSSHAPALGSYQEQIWSPYLARASERCALSGEHIGRGDPVYRPRDRGPMMPLNGDAMILASELAKDRIGA
jgi:Domain of unknown function (DUF3331)